jgi:two-component system, chemotaxis family, chemotaxis protein CheY
MAVILVADDSWLSRKMIQGYLKENGFDILQATNGREALEQIETRSPDLVILDLLMPEMDGFEVLEQLRIRKCDIPVVVLTADIQITTREKCEEYGVAGILHKPPQSESLLAVIQKALGSQ